MCINCRKRHLSLRPLTKWLKDLECPFCEQTGFLIETGEVISKGTYMKTVKQHPQYKIYRRYEQIYQYDENGD